MVKALRGVDLEIEKNEYVAIMGPSGSGKSTLMNIIGCLDTPSDGEYELNGKAVSEMSDNELAEVRNREIGFVFQNFNLLSRSTSLHNTELPLIYSGMKRKQRHQMAVAAMKAVGLADRMDHKPSELSGGQRQRVGRRPRPGEQSRYHPRGRADRQPGLEDRRGNHGAVRNPPRQGQYHHPGDPRTRYRRTCQPYRPYPRRQYRHRPDHEERSPPERCYCIGNRLKITD